MDRGSNELLSDPAEYTTTTHPHRCTWCECAPLPCHARLTLNEPGAHHETDRHLYGNRRCIAAQFRHRNGSGHGPHDVCTDGARDSRCPAHRPAGGAWARTDGPAEPELW